MINAGKALAHQRLLESVMHTVAYESILLSFLFLTVCSLRQREHPLRFIPHPKNDLTQLNGFIVVPTLISRVIIFISPLR